MRVESQGVVEEAGLHCINVLHLHLQSRANPTE